MNTSGEEIERENPNDWQPMDRAEKMVFIVCVCARASRTIECGMFHMTNGLFDGWPVTTQQQQLHTK